MQTPLRPLLTALAGTFVATTGLASELVEAGPLTDQVLLLHYKDGYVVHHKRGEPRSNERVIAQPLDVDRATRPDTYRIDSVNDPAYKRATAPVSIGRKSKGTDFAWRVDKYENNRVVNTEPDHAKEHWLYLTLPKPLKSGASYRLTIDGVPRRFTYDHRKSRSEAVHVNLLGYVPTAPAKYAYVYQWCGDRGGLDLSRTRGRRFWLIDQGTGKTAFEGKVAFRKDAKNSETFHVRDTPDGNFLGADVYECDFSAFRRPGKYAVAVEGIGRSFAFRIDADIYREAFRTVTRALYHNRSGIALTKPYTSFVRPAPHNPNVTPGFKGKLQYSSLRSLDYGSESGTADQIRPTLKGPLDSWGWYQDAGDWDSYQSHLRVPQELLLAYQLNPKAFSDGELNLPESGNGLPDILDEAAWLPRFAFRLRHELLAKGYGTGGLGLRIAGDAFGSDTKPGDVGQGSWEDVDRIYVASGEDPVATFHYAGVAAQLAQCLKLAGRKDPKEIDWVREARECFQWGLRNTRAKDEELVRPHRLYAAASLLAITGESRYESQIRADAAPVTATTELWEAELYGPAVYAMSGRARDADLLKRLRGAVLRTADVCRDTASRRALRWGGNFYFPMLVGHQTTPWVMPIAVARELVRHSDPAAASRYAADLYTTCDYFLGTNALNQTWVTGLGPRHPLQVFSMDAWYNGKPGPHPGIIPYGQWRKDKDLGQGPWDHDWPNKSVYPAIDQWPGNERYFDNRCSPLSGEFTIHQNIAPAAAIFGILCAPSRRP